MTTPELVSPFSADNLRGGEHPGETSPEGCRLASSDYERSLHLRIRHEVFVREEGLFAETDYDEHDDDPDTHHVIGVHERVAAGAVRLYPLEEPGVWKGDRLAVLHRFRPHRLGPRLVRYAVRTAAAAGGTEMVAHVLPSNVRLFERLGWRPVGEPIPYVGRLHQRVVIDLDGVRERMGPRDASPSR